MAGETGLERLGDILARMYEPAPPERGDEMEARELTFDQMVPGWDYCEAPRLFRATQDGRWYAVGLYQPGPAAEVDAAMERDRCRWREKQAETGFDWFGAWRTADGVAVMLFDFTAFLGRNSVALEQPVEFPAEDVTTFPVPISLAEAGRLSAEAEKADGVDPLEVAEAVVPCP